MAGRKYNIDTARTEFEKRGCTLLSDTYISCDKKLKYICPNGHKCEISYSNFRCGHGCPVCGCRIQANKKRYTFGSVKSGFEERGYTLLSTKYQNARYQKLKYICPNGHYGEMTYANFVRGYGCPICGSISAANKHRYTIKFVRSEFEKRGYTLLSKDYKNSSQRLKYRCQKGHINTIIYDDFKQGCGCSTCRKESILIKKLERIKGEFKGAGLLLLSTKYISYNEKLKYKCDEKGHIGWMTYAVFKRGQGCARCVNRINGAMSSKQQENLYKNIYGVMPENRCKNYNVRVGTKYIDIVLNNLKIGIEYDSMYWHYDKQDESIKRDSFLVDKGWRILHINSKHNIPNKVELNTLLNNFINSNNIVYYHCMSG